MMICPNCGAENADDGVFCSECGTKFAEDISEKADEDASGEGKAEGTNIDVTEPACGLEQNAGAADKTKKAVKHIDVKKLKKVNLILFAVLAVIIAAIVAVCVITEHKNNTPAPVEAASADEIDAWASELYADSVEKLYELGFTESKYSDGAFDFPIDVYTYGDKEDLSGGKYIVAHRDSGFELSVRSKYSNSAAAANYPNYPFFTPFDSEGTAGSVKFAKKFWAETLEDCDYLFVITSKTSNVEYDFYEGGYDRITVETGIVCIDVNAREAVYIRSIYTDTPEDYYALSNKGEEKTLLAENAIMALLNEMYEEDNLCSRISWNVKQCFLYYIVADIMKVPAAIIACVVRGCKEGKKRRKLKKQLAEGTAPEGTAKENLPVPRRTGGLAAWCYATVCLLAVPSILGLCSLAKINKADTSEEQKELSAKTVFRCLIGCILGLLLLSFGVFINS